MTIRRKTAIAIITTFVLLLTGMIATTHRVVSDGLLRIEEDFALRSAERLHAGIEHFEDALRALTGDWAHWDDTYDYVVSLDAEYEEDMLSELSIANLNLNLVLILNMEGELVYGTGFDLKSEAKTALPQGILKHIVPGGLLLTHDPDDPASCHTGIIALDDMSALVASRPILDNHMEGPARGVLIFGNYFDDGLIERLENYLRFPLTLTRLLDDGADGEENDFVRVLSESDEGYMSRYTSDHLYGHTLLHDVYGMPALLARYTLPRDIQREGKRGLKVLTAWMLLSGVAFGVVVFGLLHYSVLSRISRIARAAEAIHRSPQTAALIETSGRDEVADLGHALNEMLSAVRKSNSRVAAEKEQLAVTLASIGDAVIATDAEGRIRLMNPVAERITGQTQTEAAAKPLREVLHLADEESGDLITDILPESSHGAPLHQETRTAVLPAQDGRARHLEISSAPLQDAGGHASGAVLVLRDVTDARAVEEERLRANKLESVALLAGGIAHDFNNILTAVTANLSMARLKLPPAPEAEQYLADAENSAMQAGGLSRQLLTFAKGGEPVKRLTRLQDIIPETANFAVRGRSARCDFDIPTNLWVAEVDPGQIGQVIHNLVINAADAMPDGGLIRVSARNVTESEPPSVCIAVEDEGVGIAESHKARIFDPYFTTKQKGSGLGLATSYSIVQKHGGRMCVESEHERGSRFEVYLPAAPERIAPPDERPADIRAGAGRILVMDDQEDILKIISATLVFSGYEVVTSKNGEDAISKYNEALAKDEPFDAVLLDLTVPDGMGGLETLQSLRSVDRNVRAIVTSGYSNDEVLANYQEYGFRAALVKPFDTGALSTTVNQVVGV